ncbi:hypothetical protein [Allostreptomyces psammosilenae]|uniref:Uncharacterized membrane protein YoaK (UPF0700 family) n=1 Tax=Allostreptomyces psammosilenae TaxID=1892865 RepID=A0A852ZTX3_9ACTN|nr:hypothetical protein [Allostreptomyces psammosilenae]NYI05846.1 uncharacterized membrane protein YoaK (UPF0700 family) [Allostreptomyces psammosilenae]
MTLAPVVAPLTTDWFIQPAEPPTSLVVATWLLLLGAAYGVLLFAAPIVAGLGWASKQLVDVVTIAALMPEYLCTRAMRRARGRVAPLAYEYGEVVCALAGAVRWCVTTVTALLGSALPRLSPLLALMISLWIATLLTDAASDGLHAWFGQG